MERMPITAAEVSRSLRTTPSTVFGWLQGTRPRRRALEDLAKLLGVEPEWLLNGTGNEFVSEPLPPVTSQPKAPSRQQISDAIENGFPLIEMIARLRPLLLDPSGRNIEKGLALLDLAEAQQKYRALNESGIE